VSLKDRHLYVAGAAACAVCCAAPLPTLLGIAGAAATVATFVLAGLAFGFVVAAGALAAVWQQRRQGRRTGCDPTQAPPAGPVNIDLTSPGTRSDA
jgi:hypothetical protein